MKKFTDYRVEGRRPVGRRRRTWLESVEADMVGECRSGHGWRVSKRTWQKLRSTEKMSMTGKNGERML